MAWSLRHCRLLAAPAAVIRKPNNPPSCVPTCRPDAFSFSDLDRLLATHEAMISGRVTPLHHPMIMVSFAEASVRLPQRK